MATHIAFNPEKARELVKAGHTVYYPIPISMFLRRMVIASGLCASMSEAKRMLKFGAIEINGQKVLPTTKFILWEMDC